MTLHTPKAPETTVQRMVTNAMHVQNIEVETGWTRDDIKAVAMRMGYALDAASQRFRRAPQRKPAPAGIVLRPQTSTGAADTGQPASDPSHDRDTNRGRGGEPSSSAPVLPHTSGEGVGPSRGDDSAIANPLGSFVETSPASPEPDPEQKQFGKSGLTTRDKHALNLAVRTLLRGKDWVGFGTYHVGTSLTGAEYRDVDVRSILADDEFDEIFGTRPDLWSLLCFLIADHLARATGLPIDYQIQRQTEANANHKGMRSALGILEDYAARGDATRFADATALEVSASTSSPPAKRPGNYPTGPRLTHGATQSQIRDWARTQGLDVNPRGTVRRDIADAYAAAHQETS